MTLDDALGLVREKYGLRESYVQHEGKMVFVVKAENELSRIPAVKSPELGVGLLASEVIELAQDTVTIEELVRRKNPEIFGQTE